MPRTQKLLLVENVESLGIVGDIVNVRNGYARNFLIPQGKAKRATEENKKVFETRRAELEKAQADKLAGAQAIAAKLEGGAAEVSVFWTDAYGIRCKARFDYLRPDLWDDFKTFVNKAGKVLAAPPPPAAAPGKTTTPAPSK